MKRAPVQPEYWRKGTGSTWGSITWEEHVEAWEAYNRKYQSHQTAEDVAARFGFGYGEITELLGHPPRTWREELGAMEWRGAVEVTS